MAYANTELARVSQSGSSNEKKKVAAEIEDHARDDILALKRSLEEMLDKAVIPAAKKVVNSKREQAMKVGQYTFVMGLDLAKFIINQGSRGAMIGGILGTILSGYVPMSEGWFAFMGNTAVKTWKWAWGTTTFGDKLRYKGIQAYDVAWGASTGLLTEILLWQSLLVFEKFYTKFARTLILPLSTRKYTLDSAEEIMPKIAAILMASQAVQDAGREPSLQEVMRALWAAPEDVRNAYLLQLFGERFGQAVERVNETRALTNESPAMEEGNQTPAITDAPRGSRVWGMNQVEQSPRDIWGDIQQTIDKARRGKRGGRKAAPLVNYGSGLRQTRRGGPTTIKAMAPIMEYNDVGDDPYVMRPKVQ